MLVQALISRYGAYKLRAYMLKNRPGYGRFLGFWDKFQQIYNITKIRLEKLVKIV